MRTMHCVLAAGAATALGSSFAMAQSVSTGFDGTVTSFSSPSGGGGFFSVRALHPQGITITGIDVHAAAGTVPIGFLYRPGDYAGEEQNILSWLHLGEARVTTAGTSSPTPLPIGGVYIPAGETYSFRQVQMSGTFRYHNEATMIPLIASAEAEILRGSVQNAGYIFTSVSQNRGWNGTIHYTPGGSAPTGACCLPDGSCVELRADQCRLQFGAFKGDGAPCAGANCTQPAPGKCCLPDGTCSVALAPDCAFSGGFFGGYGTDCGEPCGKLSTPFLGPTIGAGMFNGHFFTISAVGTQDVIITGFDVNCSSSAGNNITIKIHTRPDAWLGFTDQPDQWSVHAEVPTVSAGSENPTQVRLPIGRELVIPAGQTVAVRIGTSVGGLRYSTTTFTPLVDDENLRMEFGATQSNMWSTVSTGRTWSGNLYYALGAGGPAPCYANCDGSTAAPVLNVSDFGCFLTKFAAGDPYANCDGSTGTPQLNVADFGCFLTKFAAGCR